MKKLLPLVLTGITITTALNSSYGQNNLSSDDPIFNTPHTTTRQGAQGTTSPTSYSMTNNVVANCGGGIDTIVAGSGCAFGWYSDSLGTNLITSNDSLITGSLTNDTTFYLGALAGGYDSLMPLPSHGSNFSGNVRGYYFTAPVDFVITGLRVPTNVGTGPQNIEVVRFDNQTAPPLWSSTTNAFQSLGYWANDTISDTIPTCIQVFSGDVIGIYGNRNDVNSYATSPYQTTIGGLPVTLTRSGMQNTLSSGQMADIFSESGGSIARVEMFYDMTTLDSTYREVNVVVPNFSVDSLSTSICNGDSILLGNAYQTISGIYTDSLQSIYGCDSVIVTNLTVGMLTSDTLDASICLGDSLLVGGSYQTTVGLYTDSLQSMYGCDSVITTRLKINSLPIVSLSGDSICQQNGTITLNGTPTGGTYSGTGTTGNQFDPAMVNYGTHSITYMYTDSLGCSDIDSANFTVLNCTSIEEEALENVNIFPNPIENQFTITISESLIQSKATIYDVRGKIVKTWNLNELATAVDFSVIPSGVYMLEISTLKNKSNTYRIVKN